MPSRNELIAISNIRLLEAKTLFNNQLYDGAKYLSGYVIETALKARICKILDSDYPCGNISRSFFTHDLDDLVKLAGLQKTLDAKLSSDVNFKTNWSLATNWTEVFRYKPIGTSTHTEIQDIINAIENPNDGILTWLQTKW